MDHFHTLKLDLKKDGWELLIKKEKKIFQPKPGDIAKIVIVTLSPVDYEEEKVIRSVHQIPLWVKIEKEEAKGFIGKLKTQPEHALELKDGTTFQIGDCIFFENRHILALR